MEAKDVKLRQIWELMVDTLFPPRARLLRIVAIGKFIEVHPGQAVEARKNSNSWQCALIPAVQHS